ncbi:hypothetical protein [Mycobacterium sp. MMS18-G62]
MITELQFVAITAFLIWGLVSSVCGLFQQPQEPQQHRQDSHDAEAEVDTAGDITAQRRLEAS